MPFVSYNVWILMSFSKVRSLGSKRPEKKSAGPRGGKLNPESARP